MKYTWMPMVVQGRVQLAGRTGQLCVAERSWWSVRGWPATPANAKAAINNVRRAFDKIVANCCSSVSVAVRRDAVE